MSVSDSESSVVGKLITSNKYISPDVPVKDVTDRFFQDSNIEALALVKDKNVEGLITRPKLFLTVFKRYGFEVYGKKPISAIADTSPLVFNERERLDIAMDRALERPSHDIYDDIIVVDDDGRYKGLLSVKQMVVQQSNVLANSIMQKELVHAKAKELEKMSEMKSQFIAHVTHELRSPVNAIIMLTELLKVSHEKGAIGQMKDRLALMMSSATNLRTIVTNILDLSKIEAGKMEVLNEYFDMGALLREVAENTRVLLGNKPVSVQVVAHDGPLFFLSDPIKVRQILINLTSNAAKFTDNGVIILYLFNGADKLRISVSDTGPGIREEDLEKLFTAFSQLEDTMTKRHEGTGLGLSICKNLTDILGGSISVSSIFGKGTTFEVSLPLKPAASMEETYGEN